jgi:serine/threonine-protein kinase ATR
MAPSTQRPLHLDGHEPPPSTIAAQILRTGTAATSQHIRTGPQREVFDTLLAEFLADPYVDTSEDKLDDNARFVTFLAEAAAEARARQLREQPFALGAMEKQAGDCLRAVKMTLEQQPDLLVWNGSDVRKEGANPPFVCWVIAKVLAVGAREKLGEVWDNGIDVLVTCEKALQERPAMWQTGCLISKLLRCTADALDESLTSYAAVNAKEMKISSFSASVPPATAITNLWTASNQSVALPPGYQLTLKKPNDASNMLLLLLCAISKASIGSASGSETYMWVLNASSSVLQFYHSLAKQRCLDRRRIVVCLAQIIGSFVTASSRRNGIQRASDVLAQLILSVSPSDGDETQVLLAKALSSISEHTGICNFQLFAALSAVKSRSSLWLRFMPAFQIAIEAALESNNISGPPRASQLAQNSGSDKMDITNGSAALLSSKERLRNTLTKRTLESEAALEGRPGKRQRTEEDAQIEKDQYEELVREVELILNSGNSPTVKNLRSISVAALEINDEKITSLFKSLNSIPCVGSGCFQQHTSTRRIWNSCTICDRTSSKAAAGTTGPWNEDIAAAERKAYYDIMNTLMSTSNLKNSRVLRVLAAQTIRRFVNHTKDPKYLDLAKDQLGRWCMRSFQSSFRELRIASVQALMPYLRSSINEESMYRNRSIVLELLRKLGGRDNLGLQDTFVFTWGQIGRVCGETELNLALIELVNALGHGHMVICAAAYQEIRQLAKDLDKSITDLFAPFWRSVAPEVVKDVISCPQKAQQLSDLLQLRGGVDELLVLTQTEIVPFLVLTKRFDVLQRVTQARPDIDTVEALIMQPRRNMACVIAKLLLEFGSESAAAAHLQEAAPALKGKFAELIQVDPVSTMCEVLKSTVDHGEGAQVKSKKAFDLVAKITMANSPEAKADEYLTSFLEEYVLGIMAHFTDIVDNSKDRQSLSDKRRALKAIEELIKRSGLRIELALPQVRATLHSALENPDLASQAFSAWMALMDCVEPESFQSYMPHSFAIIVQKWNVFDASTQTRAHKMVTHLVERNNTTIMNELAWMPSLAGISLFSKLESDLASRKESIELGKYLDAFATRCGSDTGIVVRQALRELVPYLALHQSQVLESKAEAIPNLYRALLDASIRFKEHDDEVVDLCAKCLGLLGCVDPNNTETVCVKHNLMVLSNFERVPEVVEFITQMLSTVLVPAFQAAPTGKQQSYLAFVMQELLRISGITDALSPRTRNSSPRQAVSSWYKLPESTQYILAPYLSSKYALTNPTAATDLLPFMPEGPTPPHAVWLRNIVFNLLHRAKGTTANLIFPKISRVIQGHDISIAAFMLPFVIQNVVADGSDTEIAFITGELASIMTYNISGCPEEDVENVKKASENVFEIFDYLSRWVHEKKEMCAKFSGKARNVTIPDDFDAMKETLQISKAEQVLDSVPAWDLAQRAFQCGLHARAIYHNEQHIRIFGASEDEDVEADYKELQLIYEQIDEPDAIEGISSKLRLLDVSQQVLDHKQAGRWTAALSHYEIAVRQEPEDVQLHLDMLHCMMASGQYGMFKQIRLLYLC